MKIPFQSLAETNKPIMHELEEAALRVIRSGWYLSGENVKTFESMLAAQCGARHCIALSNGLDSLRLTLRAYVELGRIAPGAEVIVPANTFIATFLAVSDAGLIPVAAEVSPLTYNLDFDKLPLTTRTGAIMPVHLYGTPAWDRVIMKKAADDGILIIEDNAQAIGALASSTGLNGNRHTGNLGHAAGWSFYPAKNIGALGDAGAVTTSDTELAETVRELANYGASKRYYYRYKGFNCRMDEIQAAMLTVKLCHLEEVTSHRQRIASVYDTEITNPDVIKPKIMSLPTLQVWHQYPIRHQKRDELRDFLMSNGIGTDIHYPVPPYLQDCYADGSILSLDKNGELKPARKGSFPFTEKMVRELVSLPIANITDEEARTVASIVNRFN